MPAAGPPASTTSTHRPLVPAREEVDLHTHALAAFAARLDLASVPENAKQEVRKALLDNLGCVLAGSRTTLADAADAVAQTLGGVPQASVFGRTTRTSVAQAAFVNGTAANALDFDDGYAVDGKGMGHPSSSLVPAALAMGEWRGSSGAAVLTALVAGYEVCNRVAHAICPSHERHAQVWGVGVHQGFGAAVVAARLLGLDAARLLDAIGLAGAFATVPAARKWNFGARPLFSFKDMLAIAGESGVRAALYAQHGLVGSRDILDGETGFWIMSSSDRCDFQRLSAGLGEDWTVFRFYFKPYPACRWIHAALEACEELVAEHKLRPVDICGVRIGTFRDMVESFDDRAPRSLVDGEFSMPYTVAALLSGIPVGPEWYSERTMRDPAVLDLARRIVLEVDDEAEARHFSEERKTMSVVTLTLADGREVSRRVAVARGGHDRPLDDEERERKFRSLAEPVIGPARSSELMERVYTIESVTDVSEIAALLTPA